MNIRILFHLVGIITLFVLQLALVAALPGGDYFYLSLVVLVSIVVLFGLDAAALWFIMYGFLLDLFAFRFFGFYTLLLLIILIVVYWLLTNVLTNRSLYAFLLLVTAAVLMYDLATYVVFGLPWSNFFSREWKCLLANLLLATIVFYGLSSISHRLRPVFLIRAKG